MGNTFYITITRTKSLTDNVNLTEMKCVLIVYQKFIHVLDIENTVSKPLVQIRHSIDAYLKPLVI